MKKAFLFLLSLFAFIGVQAQESPYVGAEAAAGNFFIYNVETGYWLQNNNRVGDWNSQVQVDVDGFDWELIAKDGGTWQLNPKFGSNSNHSLNSGDANGYLDTGQPVSLWTLTPVDGVSNGYTISSNGTTLGVNPDTKLLVKDGSAGTVWQLVTAEERLAVQAAKYAEVTGDNPMDLTWMIPGANMNVADEHANALVRVAPTGATAQFVTNQTNNPGNGCREVWNNTNGTYDFGYKLTGMPDGVYRFTFKGFYRDGSTVDIGGKHADGTEVLRPEIYINDKTQPVMSVCQLTSNSGGCNVKTGNYYVPDNLPDAARACGAGVYDNKAVKVVLSNNSGEIDLGVRINENGVGSDWLVLDKFQLVFYGPEDLSQSVAILQAAIDEAEAFDASTTSTAMADQLTQAIADAKAKLQSNDGEEMEAAADALTTVLNAAKALDLTALKATIALAKQEGIDTSVADDLVANATDGGAAADALFDLRAARKVKAQTMPDVYTGSEPAEGKVYIYNLGTGMFLGTGASYNTHCAVDQVGIEIELIADGDGFKMKTGRGTGWLNKGNRETSTYVDCPEHTWYFLPVSDGVYNISFDGETDILNLLGYNPHSINDNGDRYWSSIGIKREDPADPMNQWKIVTAEEREALIAAATTDNPVDVSYLIPGASLNKQDTFNWVDEGDAHHAKVDNFENWGFEFWNNSSFKFSQTLENLPAGMYEISVQAFWREGDGANQVAIVNSGGALNQKAYLFAGDQQELLPNIASVMDLVPGVGGDATSDKGIFPNWVNEALEYMETGAYWATVKAIVGEDGTLTIGVAADDKAEFGDWTVIDNFRLTYLGNDEDDMVYERALESIKDGQTYRVFTEVDGAKYYLTPEGYLADSEQKAGTFTFKKVAGDEYPYGFQLLESYFTNPPAGGNPTLANGHIATDANSKRNTWEAQVFFQNADGKYAVRATNAAGGESSWALNAKTFWTVNDGPVAEYSYDKNYVWQIEENVDPRPALLAEIKPITDTWGRKMQEIGGLVTDASQFSANSIANESIGLAGLSDGDYNTYFHSQWGNSGVTEPHYLQAELPDAADKFYFYFVKRDPVNNGNVNNRPTDIKISGSNDGTNFTEITEISEGMPTAVPPIDYMSGLVSANEAYKYIRFTIIDTNNHATDNNGNKFFTFSEFYILPSNELFDEAASLVYTNYTDIPLEGTEDLVERVNAVNEKLNGFFVEIPANVVFNDEVIKTETVSMTLGKAPVAPASFDNGLVELTPDVETVTEETEEVNFTATFKGPFEFSTDFDNAKWYNMDIRSGKHVGMGESEPYYPAAATAEQLATPEYLWAFTGNPYNLVILNYAAGAGKSLTKDGSNVVMRDGEYQWELFGNNKENGFVIREIGTENNWVNQNGGDNGPLQFWNSANGRNDDGSTFRVEKVIMPVELNAPTFNAEDGTQAEYTTLNEPLKINFTAKNLEDNGYNADDLKVKVTVTAMGDVTPQLMMGSETIHRVTNETFYIPLGETEFPVELKSEYYYQNIIVMSAELVKPAKEATDEEPATEEEVIATYEGGPIQLHFIYIEDASPEAAYERALAAIEDGANYRIFTEVDGVKYYVTDAGLLVDAEAEAGIFTFTKKENSGGYMQYGYLIDSGSKRFTNPPLLNNVANLNPGSFSTSTNDRAGWETQVLFLTGGKYAIRSCNVPDGTSSWNDAGRTYWTYAVEEVAPQYTYDPTYVWQIEGPLTTINVTYQLFESDGETKVGNDVVKKQEANSAVVIPADFKQELLYDYAAEGEIGEEDCTVKIIRSFKEGVVHQLSDLSNEKSYTIRCDRGALLTSDDHLASTAHGTLTGAEAGEFAIISYEDNYYLYSVADGKFVTFDPSQSVEGARGPLADMPTHGTEDALQMTPKTDPYFLTYFTAGGTNYGLNTNGNDPYGYVINTWMNADAGNQYYIIEAGEFDPTEALAALEAYFYPSFTVTYVIKDADGNELFTSEPQPARSGDHITELPSAFQRAFMEYSDIDVTVAEQETTVEVTATWNGPIAVAADFADITWQNMYINRGDDNHWYLYNSGDANQSFKQNPAEEELASDEYQWGFVGNAYEGLKMYNKATGESQTLTNGSTVAMADGEFVWDVLAENQGGILIGVSDGYLNQSGGATATKLALWGSATDMGSTFYVSEVPGSGSSDFEITITSTVGLSYEGLTADVPMAEILEALGAESLDGVEIFAVLPDGTRDSNYGLGTTDGWRDADGTWKAWSGNADEAPYYYVKADFSLPSAQIKEAGCYPGKVTEETTFTANYVFVNGTKEVTLTVNLVYEAAPSSDLKFSDLAVQGDEIVIEKTSTVGSSYEGLTADVDIAAILATLGVESLADVNIFAVQSDETLDPSYGLGTTDGWRDADGNWKAWTEGPAFCVKSDFTAESAQIYYIGGMPGQTDHSGSYTATFAFVNKNSADHAAVVLKVTLTYEASDVQKALEEEIAKAEALAEEGQNEDLYDQELLADALATFQEAIEAAKDKLATTDDEMAAATEELKAAEEAFMGALTGINGVNAELTGTIYDLGGRKIQKVQRGGIYIVNGKKVVIK